ncbi:MAG TPA: TIGR03668 family PPOX class F420-dependent oxidoreductase [Trebonia sp.]|jgi:PPOX class probable F420-dependent enzyme|nr:TIGR03668 family PPOX class F420-dependent oxidoreductase [Trebonia sp.]
MNEQAARDRFAAARVARLATADHDGRPHLVPVTFALDSRGPRDSLGPRDSRGPGGGDSIYIAIDHKPKTTTNLRRLSNIRENPRVTLLADHYDEDWRQLWWVRVDGLARVIEETSQREHPLEVLARKYPQYRENRPAGPVIVINAERFTGWDGAR